jgi:hypothetical protein
MPYEVKWTKVYSRPAAEIAAAAAEAMKEIDGKLAKGSDPTRGRIEANFNKSVAGKSFGNRVQLVVQVAEQAGGECALALEAFPVDPLGKKLLFGVLGDPARLVVAAFTARLDARLGQPGAGTPAAPGSRSS